MMDVDFTITGAICPEQDQVAVAATVIHPKQPGELFKFQPAEFLIEFIEQPRKFLIQQPAKLVIEFFIQFIEFFIQ